jgi:hypothetical protein
MSFIGTLLKNRRAGETGLAWNLPALAGPETLHLASPAFTDGAPIPAEHAGTRVGGRETSPPLSWSAAPRALLAAVRGPALARARLTGTYER